MPEIAISPRQALATIARNRDAVMIFAGLLVVFVPLIIPLPPLALDMLGRR